MRGLSNDKKFLLVLFLFVIFLYSFNQLNNSDTFYDLKTGQYILENFKIPTQDIFSLPAAGSLWVPHEWLAQAVFYLVYLISGFLGLIIFSALLAVLTYFILWRLAVERGANFYLTTLFLFLLSYLTLELWVPRPQVFAYLSLAILIYFLESYRISPRKKYLFGAALVIWFWANVNASFILGLVILILYFLAEFLRNRWPGKFGRSLAAQKIGNLGWLVLASAALALLTPAGYRGFLYSFYVQSAAYYLKVLEWKPITIFFYEIQTKVFLAILLLADVFLIWRLGFRKESRDATLLGLAVGVSILPFISIRHVGFWPIAVFLPVALSLSEALKNFWERFSQRKVIVALSILGITLIASRLFWMPKKFINENLIPVAAADFIQTSNLRGPLFNLYNEGGYLIWRLWPQDKVFIDGRSEVYRGQPLVDFFAVLNRHPGWENLVDKKYGINYFFFASYLAPGIRKEIEPLTLALMKKGFVLVYWNDDAMILARDTAENSEIIKRYGLKHISPFRDPAEIPANEVKTAAAEIQSLLERSRNSLVVQNYAQRFLVAH